MSPGPEQIVRDTPEDLFADAAERLAGEASADVAERGAFRVALAGGSTPEGLYRRLAAPDLADLTPWDRAEVFFGDERCVGPRHPESNYRMAREALLDHVPVPRKRVHPMDCRRDPQKAAADYARLLHERVPAGVNGVPELDLVLLGLGPDGHVASLFPGTTALTVTEPVAPNYVIRLGAWRLTLTFPVLNAARRVWLLATGEAKADVVRRALAPAPDDRPLPVHRLHPAGEWRVWLDRAAASGLHG
mgnify:CR=1 FL=1